MSYSIVDIIKNGKPGEVYTLISLDNQPFISLRITIQGDYRFIVKQGLTLQELTATGVRACLVNDSQFEKVKSVEEKVRDILRNHATKPTININDFYKELKPYLKEEV